MRLAGLVPLSLVDVPGHPAATLFTPGCNFHCGYCHNPDLVRGHPPAELPWSAAVAWLQRRRPFLDWVCITGGEPTLQPDLADALAELRRLGYRVKLDTNGSRPQTVAALLERGLCDYVAMDVKTVWSRYPEVGGNGQAAAQTAAILRSRAPDYEFRTTVAPPLVDRAGLEALADALAGSRRWVWQQFVPSAHLLDPAMAKQAPYPDATLRAWAEALAPRFGRPIGLRNLREEEKPPTKTSGAQPSGA
jgi:pyruvate formate lyase activating enzyme